MRRFSVLFGAGVTLLVLFTEGALAQSSLRLTGPSGEVGTDFDGSWVGGSEDFDRTRQTFRQWLDLTLGAFVIDPKILRFDLNLRPLFAQRRWAGGVASPDGGVERLDGGGRLHLLSGAPVSFTAFGRRVRDTNRGIYGSRTDYGFGEWGAVLNSRSWVFPGKLEYFSESRDFLSTAASGLGFREDDHTQTLRMSMESSKAWIVAERISRDDRVRDLDFTHDRVNANHRLRWGKGSSLASEYRFFRRSGMRDGTSHGWSERVHLQHTSTVSSDLSYSLLRNESWGQATTGQSAEAELRYLPNQVMELRTQALGRSQTFGLGSTSYFRAGPRLALNLPLHSRAVLRLDGEAGYEWHDQAPADEAWLAVVGEEHRVGESLRFALEEPFVDRGSLVLRSEDGSAIYQEGLDYRLVETGPRLEVFAFPGGRILPGTVLMADYRYQTLPGASAEAWIARYDLSLRLGSRRGLTIYHRRSFQSATDEFTPGLINSLLNYDNLESGLALDMPLGPLSLNLSGQYSRQRSDLFEYSSYGARGAFGLRLPKGFEGSLEGNLLHRTGEGVEFNNGQGTARLKWTPHSSLRIGGDLSLYHWDQGEVQQEKFVGWGASAEWQYHRLRIEARADNNLWRDGLDRTRSESCLVIRVGRAF